MVQQYARSDWLLSGHDFLVMTGHYSQGTWVFVTFKQDEGNFHPRCARCQQENRARVWSIKAGEISKNSYKQTSDQEQEKICIVTERKEIRAVCVLTPRLSSHSTLRSRLVAKKWSYFFCFASENLFSALMSRKGAELSTETKDLINTLSESVKNKSELSRMLNIPRTTITSVLSKYQRTGTVETLTRSCRKRTELHK